MIYSIRSSECGLIVLRDETEYCEVKFPAFWRVTYGFSALTRDGVIYELKSTGLFFWRKLALYRNGGLVGHFKRNRSLIPGSSLWLDSRFNFYDGGEFLTEVEHFFLNERADNLLFRWEISDEAIEWPTITLLLLSLQATGKSYPSGMAGLSPD